ncbi:MAG: hypothetical protein R6X25_07405 [Candidatus Krumholzibacteriia bacterium]
MTKPAIPIPIRPGEGPGVLGMRLLLLSLGVLFLAALAGLWFAPGRSQPLRTVLPPLLAGSTAALLVAGILLRRALQKIRRYDRPPFRRLLLAGLGAGAGFLILQAPALGSLLTRHAEAAAMVGSAAAAGAQPGLLFVLLLLHALHVVAGLLAVGWVAWRAHSDPRRYTPDDHTPVRHAVMYWGFLETIWLVMLAAFLVI